MKRVIFCLLALALLLGSVAQATVVTPQPLEEEAPRGTPFVATPSPESYLVPTRAPRGLVTAGDISFDAGNMTIEERDSLISQLQALNMRDSIEQYPIVKGLITTRQNPVYVGQRCVFTQQPLSIYEDDLPDFELTMAVMEVVRGEEAALLVHEMNALNPAPPEGQEYVVTTFEIGMTSEDPTATASFGMYEFQPVSDRGRNLSYAFITDDMNVLTLLNGGSGTLRVTALVDEGTRLLLLYRDKIWFSTETLSE